MAPDTDKKEQVRRTTPPRMLDHTIRRRHSREWAVQMLFALDFAPFDEDKDEFFSGFWGLQEELFSEMSSDPAGAHRSFDGEAAKPHKAFAEELVACVRQHQDEIDSLIESKLEDWSLQRLGGVERNVLRLALCEMFFIGETPPAIIINEAVDIVKYFSTRESGRFVNGLLDRAAKEASRPVHYKADTPAFNRARHDAEQQ